MEYAPGVELQDYIFNLKSKEDKNLDDESRKSIIKQLLKAIKHLHDENICHRDIKPENIIFNNKTNQIKLIDFGISCKFKDKGYSEKTGTEVFMAPEMQQNKSYNEKIDIWGVGLILCFLAIGKIPRNGSKGEMQSE